jgi:hypothetical protein
MPMGDGGHLKHRNKVPPKNMNDSGRLLLQLKPHLKNDGGKVTTNSGGRDCTAEVCISIENVNTSAGTLDIYMINSEPVAGFQFYLEGMTITDVSGGTGDEYMTFVNFNPGKIVGASFSGGTIPSGSGSAILTQVTFSDVGNEVCFISGAENIVSDLNAAALYSEWGDCVCVVGVDCFGQCGGAAVEDCCNVCDGDNSTCSTCCGLPFNDDCTSDCYIDYTETCCTEETTIDCELADPICNTSDCPADSYITSGHNWIEIYDMRPGNPHIWDNNIINNNTFMQDFMQDIYSHHLDSDGNYLITWLQMDIESIVWDGVDAEIIESQLTIGDDVYNAHIQTIDTYDWGIIQRLFFIRYDGNLDGVSTEALSIPIVYCFIPIIF